MTTYTPEQLRELASALPGTCADIVRAHADALEELARLRSRLEIDFVTDGNGNRVPFPGGAPDGIACRDETIRMLESKLAEREAERETFYMDYRMKCDAGQRAAEDRAEKAEAELARVKGHAEALADLLEFKCDQEGNYVTPRCLDAYRRDYPGEEA